MYKYYRTYICVRRRSLSDMYSILPQGNEILWYGKLQHCRTR